jgi:hypothetical protein
VTNDDESAARSVSAPGYVKTLERSIWNRSVFQPTTMLLFYIYNFYQHRGHNSCIAVTVTCSLCAHRLFLVVFLPAYSYIGRGAHCIIVQRTYSNVALYAHLNVFPLLYNKTTHLEWSLIQSTRALFEKDSCLTQNVLAAKCAQQRNDLNWETLALRRKIARIWALFKAYTGERAWKTISDRLQKPCYLSRVDHDKEIWNSKQKTDVRKYSFVNRTIWFWN